MKERIAIINGFRTPFCKSGGALKGLEADDLAAYVIKELIIRTSFPKEDFDEAIIGNVCQPVHAANVAHVSTLKAGLPIDLPGYTVGRNCASGMESITTAADKILAGEANIILAGATESMSNIPFIYSKKMKEFFIVLSQAKTFIDKLKVLIRFRPSFLKPIIGLEKGLTDPICGMIMGKTAEILSREFFINREEQDKYALESHRRATAAIKSGRFAEEIIPMPTPPGYFSMQLQDEGPREDQSMEALSKLKPYFDRLAGSVTVGNACQVTDGAAAVILMKESEAKARKLNPMGYLRAYTYAALEGCRMGLGPAYATAKLLDKTGILLKDFDLIEINEAFAAQIIANEKAFASSTFAKKHLGRDKAIGKIDPNILNVNGGAIALGHPVGATGMRLIITILKELTRRRKNLGLATLCVGGGQGAALALEVQ